MLFSDNNLELVDSNWRRINMRKVAHLAGAEMIHNLYDRHWPRINSLRFRHTVTTFSQGIVESYAPIKEWDYLQYWLSKKFEKLDSVLLEEIEAILNPDYVFIDSLLSRVDASDIATLNNQDLALLFIDVMDLPLGDIYKLNVVQIEYGLNTAINKLLEVYEPNATDRHELLSRLIAPGVLTVSQQEEIAFNEIIRIGKQDLCSDPSTSRSITRLIAEHHEKFAPTHCAYGEELPSIKDYTNKYIFSISLTRPLASRNTAEAEVASQFEGSKKLLSILKNPDLAVLCNLMARIGVFRDTNKAKLGETVARRLRILDEISVRTRVKRDFLDYYLVAEIVCLLDESKPVNIKTILERKKNGVTFTRYENVSVPAQRISTTDTGSGSQDTLKGVCASPGTITGKARIILSKDDIKKMKSSDIMVAIGTDFDLLEIMNISCGIVTEEGGLLSHASVVSRELKKPCLIGVRNATKLIKDGDTILLDATEGKITKLS